MSLLDEVLEQSVLPTNECPYSGRFIEIASGVADKLRARGRTGVRWNADRGEYSLEVFPSGAVAVTNPDGPVLTWFPADEVRLSIRGGDKQGALERAVAALETLIG